MTRDDQFFALFLLLATMWYIAAALARHPHEKLVCSVCGTAWVLALLVGVLT